MTVKNERGDVLLISKGGRGVIELVPGDDVRLYCPASKSPAVWLGIEADGRLDIMLDSSFMAKVTGWDKAL